MESTFISAKYNAWLHSATKSTAPCRCGTFRHLSRSFIKHSVDALTMSPAPNPSQQCADRLRVLVPRENRRSAVRYRLSAKVVISWTGGDGIEHELTGHTRDISPGGAYIFSSIFPPLKQTLHITIHLPMFAGESRIPCVDVRGHVLRVDSDAAIAECGFSVCNEKVTLCGI